MSETTWIAVDDGWVINSNFERICQCADNDEADRLVAATDTLRAEVADLREQMKDVRWVENRIEQLPDSISLFLIIGDVAHAEIFKVSGGDSWSWWSRLEQNRYVGTLEEAKAATFAEARRAVGLGG